MLACDWLRHITLLGVANHQDSAPVLVFYSWTIVRRTVNRGSPLFADNSVARHFFRRDMYSLWQFFNIARTIYDVNLSLLCHNTRDAQCTVAIFLPTKRRLLTGKRLFDENVVLCLFYLQCLPPGWTSKCNSAKPPLQADIARSRPESPTRLPVDSVDSVCWAANCPCA